MSYLYSGRKPGGNDQQLQPEINAHKPNAKALKMKN